jgi:hypothetical protein
MRLSWVVHIESKISSHVVLKILVGLTAHASETATQRVRSSSIHRQGDGINEKLESRPAKIAPPRSPKEARNSPIPRCAMQTRLLDEPNL